MFLRIITSGWFLAALVIIGFGLVFVGKEQRKEAKQDPRRQEQLQKSINQTLSNIKIDPCPATNPDCKKPGNQVKP
ncbi:MAG: hypothetical protein FD175_2586 [Beijerinckiaceae bacterium]|nr:MAG: hypothetical protein FD175_2586 [Beijerinckiaceae bacterium]